jgi:predicted enzyme related to lactoylglutathione lyase
MSKPEHDRQIDYVEFPAADLAAAKQFYSSVFGWQFTDYGPDYTTFEAGRIGGGFRQEPAPSASGGRGGALVILYAVDLEAMKAKVQAAGGKIVHTHEFPGGRRFHFTDPAGNELAVWSEA